MPISMSVEEYMEKNPSIQLISESKPRIGQTYDEGFESMQKEEVKAPQDMQKPQQGIQEPDMAKQNQQRLAESMDIDIKKKKQKVQDFFANVDPNDSDAQVKAVQYVLKNENMFEISDKDEKEMKKVLYRNGAEDPRMTTQQIKNQFSGKPLVEVMSDDEISKMQNPVDRQNMTLFNDLGKELNDLAKKQEETGVAQTFYAKSLGKEVDLETARKLYEEKSKKMKNKSVPEKFMDALSVVFPGQRIGESMAIGLAKMAPDFTKKITGEEGLKELQSVDIEKGALAADIVGIPLMFGGGKVLQGVSKIPGMSGMAGKVATGAGVGYIEGKRQEEDMGLAGAITGGAFPIAGKALGKVADVSGLSKVIKNKKVMGALESLIPSEKKIMAEVAEKAGTGEVSKEASKIAESLVPNLNKRVAKDITTGGEKALTEQVEQGWFKRFFGNQYKQSPTETLIKISSNIESDVTNITKKEGEKFTSEMAKAKNKGFSKLSKPEQSKVLGELTTNTKNKIRPQMEKVKISTSDKSDILDGVNEFNDYMINESKIGNTGAKRLQKEANDVFEKYVLEADNIDDLYEGRLEWDKLFDDKIKKNPTTNYQMEQYRLWKKMRDMLNKKIFEKGDAELSGAPKQAFQKMHEYLSVQESILQDVTKKDILGKEGLGKKVLKKVGVGTSIAGGGYVAGKLGGGSD